MNLSTLSFFIKKYFWIPFYITIIVLFALLVVFRQDEKQTNALPPIEPLKVDGQPLTSSKYSINIERPQNAPQTMPVYEILDGDSFTDIASEIIRTFNVSGQRTERDHSEYGKGVTINGTTGTLLIYKNLVSYNSNPASLEKSTDFTEDAIANSARNYLYGLNFIDQPIGTFKINYYHFPDGEEENFYLDADIAGASLARLEFPQFVDNFEILNPSTPTSVTYNQEGELLAVNVSKANRLNKVSDYPILSFDEAVERLTIVGGNTISTRGAGTILADEDSNLRKVASTDVKKAYLAYYPTLEGKTLQPVWVFEGESQINNQPITTTTVIPAVAP